MFILFKKVGRDGFEPSKSSTSDLQSDPFGHSGTYPYKNNKNKSWWTDSNPRPADYKSAALPTELHQQIKYLRKWAGMDSNHRSHRRQIYSLIPLATREPAHIKMIKIRAGGRTRTPDLLITNQLLYQLSYTSKTTCYILSYDLKYVNTLFENFDLIL